MTDRRSPAILTHKREETRLHFVGIGGIGMSGIAEVFLNQGYPVSGSDLADSESIRRMQGLGARIAIGHRAENVGDASVVVISSAVRADNPEVVAARDRGTPVIPRAEMLGELMRGKTGIAVGGTHGKTTTTSMLATVFTAARLDPTLVIGGKVDSLGGNAKLGHGQYVIAEADESDGSFLHLPATYGVVTNIDNDHLDHFGTLEAVEQAFLNFVGKLPFYGVAAVCGEDPGVRRCQGRWTKPVVTYGLSPECDFYATDVRSAGMESTFRVHARPRAGAAHEDLGELRLHVPGRHNVLNALATAAVSYRLGLPFATIAAGLAEFRGVKRRFDIRWRDDAARRMIVDDYGHHPTEVRATLAAARTAWGGRIVAVFQPHRYSRTQLCRRDFAAVFGDADVVLVTDIYAAGEDPIPGVNAEALADEIRGAARPGQEVAFVGSLDGARDAVGARFRDGDLVLCLGAGSITRLPDQIAPGAAR